MLETKSHAALASAGWDVGDRAYRAVYGFGDEFEPVRWSEELGLFRSKEAAKTAVESALTQDRVTSDDRETYWWGTVDEGDITDETSDWGKGYGSVRDWSFERDDKVDTIWMHAGLDWNE